MKKQLQKIILGTIVIFSYYGYGSSNNQCLLCDTNGSFVEGTQHIAQGRTSGYTYILDINYESNKKLQLHIITHKQELHTIENLNIRFHNDFFDKLDNQINYNQNILLFATKYNQLSKDFLKIRSITTNDNNISCEIVYCNQSSLATSNALYYHVLSIPKVEDINNITFTYQEIYCYKK